MSGIRTDPSSLVRAHSPILSFLPEIETDQWEIRDVWILTREDEMTMEGSGRSESWGRSENQRGGDGNEGKQDGNEHTPTHYAHTVPHTHHAHTLEFARTIVVPQSCPPLFFPYLGIGEREPPPPLLLAVNGKSPQIPLTVIPV